MIAVLGCGPAGLMAAYAAAMAGNPVVIFSNPEKSKLGGAQFLHKPIPGINNVEEPDAVITYRLRGDAATYQRKVYGDDSVPFVSFSGLENGQKQDAWNLIETYDKLWAMLGDQSLTPKKITPEFVQQLLDSKDFSTVFSTVPLPAICKARAGLINEVHHFHVQEVAIAIGENYSSCPDNTIIYDGTPDRSWYRSSNLFGVPGTEWRGNMMPPAKNLVKDKKPIHTTCDCFPDVIRLGRRGTWTKGVLTHDAFEGAMKEVMPDA